MFWHMFIPWLDSGNTKAKDYIELKVRLASQKQPLFFLFSPLIEKFTFNQEFTEVLVYVGLLQVPYWMDCTLNQKPRSVQIDLEQFTQFY